MIAAVLLCAGGSTRFTGDGHKLLIPFLGRPLITWALGNAQAAELDEVIVVVGPADLSSFIGAATMVTNPDWASGLSSSLGAGVREAAARGHETVVVGLGDQPFITPMIWNAVAKTDSPIAVANFDGQRTPPVRLARSVWGFLPTQGDLGAREVIRTHPDLVQEVRFGGSPVDIDTEADFLEWSRSRPD